MSPEAAARQKISDPFQACGWIAPRRTISGSRDVAPGMSKQNLSERDICTKFITPALVAAGWDVQAYLREEVSFTKGRVIVRGKMTARGEAKHADYILYHSSGTPLALIEAKDNRHTVGAGMQQALGYAETLHIPFVFSSNGDAFLFQDRTLSVGEIEKEISLNAFPSPAELWARYTDLHNILLPPLAEQRQIVAKVDELMAVLDALEAALTTARTTSENLLAATVAALTAA